MPNSLCANTQRSMGRLRYLSILCCAMAVPLVLGLAGCDRQASTETLLQEAQSFYDKGDYRSAVIQLKNALQNSPDDEEIRYRLGVAYNRTGDGVSAEKELKKALELKSDHPKAAMELGG